MDDRLPAYLISLRRSPSAPLEHFAIQGTWEEVERLVQDVAWRFWQVGFAPLEVSRAEVFRRRHPDLVDRAPR